MIILAKNALKEIFISLQQSEKTIYASILESGALLGENRGDMTLWDNSYYWSCFIFRVLKSSSCCSGLIQEMGHYLENAI